MWLSTLTLIVLLSNPLLTADWPQWRGPERNGVAAESPALIETLTPATLKKVWESEPIPSIPNGHLGGYPQPTIAGDRVYVIEGWRGLALDTLITELTEKNEGGGIPPEELAKITPIPQNKFVTAAEFEDWLKTRNITPEAHAAIMQRVGIPRRDNKGSFGERMGSQRRAAMDILHALDRSTGKTIYRVEFPGQFLAYPTASVPTVADERLYFISSAAVAYCVDTATGKKIWECPLLKKSHFQHSRGSSPLFIGGKIIAASENEVCGIDAKTGQKIWSTTTIFGEKTAPVAHKFNNQSVTIFAGAPETSKPEFRHMAALDPATGKELWRTPIGRTASTPMISGDICVLSCGPESAGPVAYKITETHAQQIWATPFKDDKYAPAEYNYPSAIITNSHVYIAGKGKAFCLELATGAVKWSENVPGAVLGTGILADGKILLPTGADLVMFRATPEKFEQLGRIKNISVQWTTPAFADGFLFIRTEKNVTCYDLRK
ncbi:MAG: PQQ-binding-like beta-propeller repeat protein [Phycisphaerales bacterium]|nr:PQQ-binding-like beta-propeller repeat protein [Phycisphaerales bacterium]